MLAKLYDEGDKDAYACEQLKVLSTLTDPDPAHVAYYADLLHRTGIRHVIEALNRSGKPVRGSRICVLGVAYKKDVDDARESPSFVLMERLLELGAELSYSDPHVPHLPRMRNHDLPELSSRELTEEFLAGLDCALIATDHTGFDYAEIVRCAPLVVDTRNATKHVDQSREKIVKC